MWEGHPRTSTAAWRKLRQQVLRRDNGICHICGKPGATDVDHITPVAEGGTDEPANLAPIHPHPCHARKSAAEGARARWRNHKRSPEPHPGMRVGGHPLPSDQRPREA